MEGRMEISVISDRRRTERRAESTALNVEEGERCKPGKLTKDDRQVKRQEARNVRSKILVISPNKVLIHLIVSGTSILRSF
jgi:hypothetical protein